MDNFDNVPRDVIRGLRFDLTEEVKDYTTWPTKEVLDAFIRRKVSPTDKGVVDRRKERMAQVAIAIADKEEVSDQLLLPIPEVLKQEGWKPNDEYLQKIIHLERLSKLTGRTGLTGVDSKLYNRIKDAGFFWLINHKFIEKFQYAATLRPLNVITDNMAVREKSRQGLSLAGIKYIGDVPDFILDKAELALSLGLTHITVHSHQPMPTELVVPKEDPVAIAWPSNPSIIEIRGRFSCSKENVGIVIGIWEGENEIGKDII